MIYNLYRILILECPLFTRSGHPGHEKGARNGTYQLVEECRRRLRRRWCATDGARPNAKDGDGWSAPQLSV